MPITTDLSTAIGKVRNIIGDMTDAPEVLRFSDARIEAFLSLNEDNVRLAAADAQDTTASDQALVLKVGRIGNGDAEVDGEAVARALRAHATALRLQAGAGGTGSGVVTEAGGTVSLDVEPTW